MYFKKLYITVLVTMTLLAALGVWVIVDGAAAWRERPRVDSLQTEQATLSSATPYITGGIPA